MPRLFLALVLFSMPVRAQGVALTGVVSDPSEVVVPNAWVELRSAGAKVASQQTAADGTFRFEGLKPGTYEVIVTREGFENHVSLVRVRAGARPPGPLHARLKLAEMHQEITITEIRIRINTQVADNLDAPTFSREELDRLPSMNNDPLSAIMRFVDLSSLPESGVEVVVDGIPSSRRVVSPSAIQEIRINQNPYSAEFTGGGGARIEIITSPTTTVYHGAINYMFRDYHLDARPAFATSRPPDRRRIVDGNLTGPIGKTKRMAFVLSGESVRTHNNPLVFARTLDGDVRLNSPLSLSEDQFSARVTRQISGNQQISVRLEIDDDTLTGGAVGGFTLPEAGMKGRSGGRQVNIQHRATLTRRLVHELQVRAGRRFARSSSMSPDAMKIVVAGAFTGGSAQIDNRNSENRAQWHWTLGYLAGKHSLKAGFSSPDVNRRTLIDRTNFLGTYTFTTLENYRLGRPLSFQQQQGDPLVRLWVTEVGAFVEDEIRLRPSLSAYLGLRWERQNYFTDNNNFAPRLGLAWAPDKSRKTVLRGGAGLFYDRGQWRALADTLRYDGLRLRDILIREPGFPSPFAGGPATAAPPNISRFDSTIRTPYRLMYSLTAERQLPKAVLAVTYRRQAAAKLYRSRDINAPMPGTTRRIDPAVGILRNFESSAALRAQHLEFTLRTQSIKRFTGTLQYAFGTARNNTDGLYAFPANNWDLSLEWAPHDEIRRHRFQSAGTVKVPRIGDLGLIFQAASGNAFDLTTGRDDNHDGFARDRPPGVRRNSLQNPGFAELDARWSRDFFLSPKAKEKGPVLTIGADGSNAINKLNPSNVIGNQSSPFFLQPVNSRAPRRIMLFVRLKF